MYDVKVDLEKATNRRHTDQRELEQLKWKDAKSKVCLLCGLSGCIYVKSGRVAGARQPRGVN